MLTEHDVRYKLEDVCHNIHLIRHLSSQSFGTYEVRIGIEKNNHPLDQYL